jgi:hypothetical protein
MEEDYMFKKIVFLKIYRYLNWKFFKIVQVIKFNNQNHILILKNILTQFNLFNYLNSIVKGGGIYLLK